MLTTTYTDAIPLAAARDLFPRVDGNPPCLATVRRWTLAGVVAASGATVRLQCFRAGRRLYTRREWVADFIEQQNAGVVVETRRHENGMTEAKRQLIARGVYGPTARKQLLGK